MANATYRVINIKESKGTASNGSDFDNRNFLCFTTEDSRYCIAGPNTDTLKMKADDFNYALRFHNYISADIIDSIIKPEFDKNGYMTDFVIQQPDGNGEL